jgi:hypothetical protein
MEKFIKSLIILMVMFIMVQLLNITRKIRIINHRCKIVVSRVIIDNGIMILF